MFNILNSINLPLSYLFWSHLIILFDFCSSLSLLIILRCFSLQLFWLIKLIALLYNNRRLLFDWYLLIGDSRVELLQLWQEKRLSDFSCCWFLCLLLLCHWYGVDLFLLLLIHWQYWSKLLILLYVDLLLVVLGLALSNGLIVCVGDLVLGLRKMRR